MPELHADTVIVGAGAAGAVVAARLTERTDRDVILLEAGVDHPDPARLPADLRDGTRNSMRSHDWGYTHRVNARQPLRFPFPRGRVVGGSSAVNTCIALRGVPEDYDEWAARGLPEWSWAHCLPAFKRLERDLDFADEHHGADGPIPIRRHPPDELVPWQRAFLEACTTLGLPRADDANRPGAEGASPHPMNKIGGERMGAARCYLTPAVRARPNLRILASTLVRRVLFEGRRAVGVEVESAGAVSVVRARRVVLCAGAIATPGVLLRSGVGPRAKVEGLGVALVADVPAVAQRLLDHPGAAFFLWPRRGLCDTAHPLIQTGVRFRSRDGSCPNDLQVQPGSAAIFPRFSLPLVSMMCHVGKPRGHGSLTFASADPRAAPDIRSALLDDPHDRALAVEALSLAYAITQQAPMRGLARVVWPPEPAVARPSALDGWVRGVCDSGYHPCGTAPMGADGDPDAAADGRGRVRGTDGLYVADASLMPTVPTSNIHLPTLMIGERFGEWLREGD